MKIPLDRTERVVEKLKVKIKDFNTGVDIKRIEQLKSQRDELSAKEVEDLREKNIVIKKLELSKNVESLERTNILTKKQEIITYKITFKR